MIVETEPSFARDIIANPPSQRVEEAASQSHESRRIPDTYIYTLGGGKFHTPSGVIVEDKIEKNTLLGQIEFSAFEKMQKWADQEASGFCVWFSPPYPEVYPVSKIIIQEISAYENKKGVINRAIVLDNNAQDLMDLAEGLTGSVIENPEYLRTTPIFPDIQRFGLWFDKLAHETSQVDLIKKGEDLNIKIDTYASLSDIEKSISTAGKNQVQDRIYQVAYEQGLIGNFPESCPKTAKTAFNSTYEDSISTISGEAKYVKNCGNCGITIEAVILKGYRCKLCGGEYKGC